MSETSLLDTHVLLWAVEQPKRLARPVRSLIGENRYVVSVATLWELINRKQRRDAPVKDPVAWWDRYVVRQQTVILPIRLTHIQYLDRLPLLHRDPFDRVLVAQAAVEEMTLVTADAQVRAYGTPTRDATA
jgi:PIN domain nuclease of toxin-antitoxin system